MMAVLGARLLEEAKPSVESAQTIKTRLAGERSVLSLIASNASELMTWALREMLLWSGPYEVSDTEDFIQLNTDFVDTKLTSADLASLTAALQANTISYPTYFYCLQRGEIIPEERTLEDELELINVGENPALPPPVVVPRADRAGARSSPMRGTPRAPEAARRAASRRALRRNDNRRSRCPRRETR